MTTALLTQFKISGCFFQIRWNSLLNYVSNVCLQLKRNFIKTMKLSSVVLVRPKKNECMDTICAVLKGVPLTGSAASSLSDKSRWKLTPTLPYTPPPAASFILLLFSRLHFSRTLDIYKPWRLWVRSIYTPPLLPRPFLSSHIKNTSFLQVVVTKQDTNQKAYVC